MDTLMTIVYLIYLVWAWSSINYLQNRMGLAFFANLRGFMQIVITKFFIANLLGWLIIPIVLIHKVFTR